MVRDLKVVGWLIALAFGAVACGGGSEGGATTVVESLDGSAAGESASSNETEPNEMPDTTDAADATDATDATDASEPSGAGSGGGVILADLCSGGQPLDGAITLEDLFSYGILTSTSANVEGSGAYDALDTTRSDFSATSLKTWEVARTSRLSE